MGCSKLTTNWFVAKPCPQHVISHDAKSRNFVYL